MLINKMEQKVIIKAGNPELIAERIFGMMKRIDINDCHKFVYGLPLTLAEETKNAENFEDIREKLTRFVEKSCDKSLSEKTNKLKEMWAEKEDKYFNLIRKTFGYECPYDKFFGYTNNVLVGSYGDKNDFVIRMEEDWNVPFYSIMEEIFHIIYWDFWRKVFKNNDTQPWLLKKSENAEFSAWEISEVIPEYVFDFKGNSGREKFYTWLPRAKKILNNLWNNKKSFADFLIKAHRLKRSNN